MKYLLSLIGDESRFADMTPEEQSESMKAWDAYTRATIDAGVHLGGEGLQPSSTATTVGIRVNGETIVTDGPFAETKEALGGFYVIECGSIEEALEWAAKVPSAEHGSTEVRPVIDYEAVTSGNSQSPAEAQS